MTGTVTWDLSKYVGSSDEVLEPSLKESVIVLNYHLPQNVAKYWSTMGTKIVADGGLKFLNEKDKKHFSFISPKPSIQSHSLS